MTHNHSTISIHNHSTLLGLGLENDGKQMISNYLQGKLDRLWMIRGGSTLGLGRIVSGDAGRIDSGADRPVSPIRPLITNVSHFRCHDFLHP